MKITITQEFDTVEEALDFLAPFERQRSGPPIAINLVPHPNAAELPLVAPAPKARKPRADAGKVRGAYKPRETARAVEGAEHTTAKPEGAAKPSDTSAPATSGPATAPATAPSAAAPLTIDDLRAAMSKLNNTPGKGMSATIGALGAFCVNRISELPAERYEEFHAHILKQIASAA